jgi:hypothetical protein
VSTNGETFEATQLRLLRASYARLGVRLDKSPEAANAILYEVAVLVRRAAGVYGLGVFAEIGKPIVAAERERLGFCVQCEGSPNPISSELTPNGDSYGMCDPCLASVRTDEEDEPNV